MSKLTTALIVQFGHRLVAARHEAREPLADEKVLELAKSVAPDQVLELLNAAANQSVFAKGGADYLLSTFGTTKAQLLVLSAKAQASTSSSVTGASLAMHQFGAKAATAETLSLLSRILTSPLPGEDLATVVTALRADRALQGFASTKIEALASVVSEFPDRADSLIKAFLATNGRTGVQEDVSASVEDLRHQEIVGVNLVIAKQLRADPWVAAMLEAEGQEDKSAALADYVTPDSARAVSQLVVAYFEPSTNKRLAQQLISTLESLRTAPQFDLMPSLTSPLSLAAAELIVRDGCEQFDLAEKFGRYMLQVEPKLGQDQALLAEALERVSRDSRVDVVMFTSPIAAVSNVRSNTRADFAAASALVNDELTKNPLWRLMISEVSVESSEGAPMLVVRTIAEAPSEAQRRAIAGMIADYLDARGSAVIVDRSRPSNTVWVVGLNDGIPI